MQTRAGCKFPITIRFIEIRTLADRKRNTRFFRRPQFIILASIEANSFSGNLA